MKALTLIIATLEVGRQGREWATGDSRRVRVMVRVAMGGSPLHKATVYGAEVRGEVRGLGCWEA